MLNFEYKTSSGTNVVLTINTLTDIIAVVNGKNIVCYAEKGFVYNFNTNPPTPALNTDLKINEQGVSLEITDEIQSYIRNLKDEEKISKLPLREQLKTKIQKLKNETNFTYFVDADIVTGKRYFALIKRYDKGVWSEIAKHFTHIDTSHHSDDFDAMHGSNYKGWLTDNPSEVDAILRGILKIDNTKEILALEKELEEIEFKEKHDIEYKNNLFKESVRELKEKFPDYKERIEKLSEKASGLTEIGENKIKTEKLIDALLKEDKTFQKCIYDPEELPKITSSVYAGGYKYLHKENGVVVVPTENYIIVVCKPKYSKEWWNNMSGVIINGFFAEFGASYIRVYKKEENITRLLEKLGFKWEKYYEVSKYFLIGTSNYRDDLYNIVNLSDDYNYMENKEDVLEKYTREKRWTWKSKILRDPTLEEIKRIGKFKSI